MAVKNSEKGQQKKLRESQVSPIKGPAMDLRLTQTHSLWDQLQCSSWKNTSSIWRENEVSGIRVNAKRQLPPVQNSRGQAAAIVPFVNPPAHRATERQHHIETPSAWFTKVASSCRLSKALPHLTYDCAILQKTVLLRQESKQLYLIHKNKLREAAKMRRQRNMTQMKEKNKNPEKELNRVEITNLSNAQFKTMIIGMLKELTGYFNSIKKTQA